MQGRRKKAVPAPPRKGLARVISRAGLCSRSEAARQVADGRVSVNGRVVRDPEHPVATGRDRVAIDGRPLDAAARVYVAVNKPRGLVTTVRDEQGRDTVYRCLDGSGLGWLAPVGRLDRASEGLLLMSNDPVWAARITGPESGTHKTYHVQVDAVPGPDRLAAIAQGAVDRDERLGAVSVRLLRHGGRNAWLEVVLAEGRNRHIRRLLDAHGLAVLRLVRVAIGEVGLGSLPKGGWRHLEPAEVAGLAGHDGDHPVVAGRAAG